MVQLLLSIIYISFISLGLPDALLGAAWPAMYPELNVPVSFAGNVSMIICAGTIFSSLMSDRLTRWLGTGRVTALSVATTAAALFGFSISHSYGMVCLWAIPYGLGAGSVDAALNNYVALHYESRHMSWLHCFWGIGASMGPYVMGWALSGGMGWNTGYRVVSILQVILTAILLLSLPLWKSPAAGAVSDGKASKALSLPEVLRIPGAAEVMLCFFCYCSIEHSCTLWTASYLNLAKNIHPDTAASFASIFVVGLTCGRAGSGFLTMKLNDDQMIRLGQLLIAVGLALMLLPLPLMVSLTGLLIMGLGCAPIYPCIIHSTPNRFGADKSQAIIGVQMASAYSGSLVMPALFGLLAEIFTIAIFPVFLLAVLSAMVWMHKHLIRKTAHAGEAL